MTVDIDVDLVGLLISELGVEWPADGFSYDDGKLTVPSQYEDAVTKLMPSMQRKSLIAYAAAKRFAIETGGITVNGALVDTSRDSQNMINGAYNYAKANPDKAISFKGSSGWVNMTADEAIAVGEAVGDHVQACFAAEGTIAAAIAAGKIKDQASIDAAAWPTNNGR